MNTREVSELMTHDVRALAPSDSLLDAYDLMSEGRFRHVPIVEDDTIVGLLSERDLLRHALVQTVALPLSAQRAYLAKVSVAEIMVRVPYTVAPDTLAGDAGQMMLEHKLGCLPVVDNQHLVGILTESDFVRAIAEV
ncbi:MAG: CBS domain-containing protein [Myxococcota bacterium]